MRNTALLSCAALACTLCGCAARPAPSNPSAAEPSPDSLQLHVDMAPDLSACDFRVDNPTGREVVVYNLETDHRRLQGLEHGSVPAPMFLRVRLYAHGTQVSPVGPDPDWTPLVLVSQLSPPPLALHLAPHASQTFHVPTRVMLTGMRDASDSLVKPESWDTLEYRASLDWSFADAPANHRLAWTARYPRP